MDWLYRMMDIALEPKDVLSSEERAYVLWVRAGKPTDVTEPVDPTAGMTAREGKPNGNPFDDGKNELNYRVKERDPTEGPEVVNGHPWRKPM